MKRTKMVKLITLALKNDLLKNYTTVFAEEIADVALSTCEENGMVTQDYVSVSETHLGTGSWDEDKMSYTEYKDAYNKGYIKDKE